MDIVLVLLRLIHILAGVTWFGIGAAMAFYVAPAALAAGESGLHFFHSLFKNTSFSRIFASVSGTTVLAGLLLYAIGNSASHFTTTGNAVLGIGAVAGVLAILHGGAATGRATKALGMALEQHIPKSGGAIPADALAVLRGHAEKMLTHSRISFALTLIALIGMGAARYL